MAEALQDLITKNAKNNEIEDIENNDQEPRGEQDDQGSDTNPVSTNKEAIAWSCVSLLVFVLFVFFFYIESIFIPENVVWYNLTVTWLFNPWV